MIYAQFYGKSAISDELIEGCGDRSVFVLDGRNTLRTQIADAKAWGARHGWLAFKIYKGDTFTRSRPISSLQYMGVQQ